MLIKCLFQNILDTAIVTMSLGTVDAAYPLYRLNDRDIGRFCMPTAATTIEILINQSAAPAAVDRLMVAPGHNLAGMTLDLKHSPDNVTYTPAVAQWAGAAGLIDKSFNSITRAYWKFIITAPGSIPRITELMLGEAYEWERNPQRPTGPSDPVFNVETVKSPTGKRRFLVYGASQQRRSYNSRCSDAQKANILSLNAAWAGSKPFYFRDVEGTWIYGLLTSQINMSEKSAGMHTFEFNFEEQPA